MTLPPLPQSSTAAQPPPPTTGNASATVAHSLALPCGRPCSIPDQPGGDGSGNKEVHSQGVCASHSVLGSFRISPHMILHDHTRSRAHTYTVLRHVLYDAQWVLLLAYAFGVPLWSLPFDTHRLPSQAITGTTSTACGSLSASDRANTPTPTPTLTPTRVRERYPSRHLLVRTLGSTARQGNSFHLLTPIWEHQVTLLSCLCTLAPPVCHLLTLRRKSKH